MSNAAIILAGGSGQRFESDMPKQFIKLAGKPILEHTIKRFDDHPEVDEIIVVTHKNYIEHTSKIIEKAKFRNAIKVTEGGSERKDSTFNGLKECSPGTRKVLVHDAVRPFVSKRIITDCIKALDTYKSVDVAIKSADTIIKVNEKNYIDEIPKRSELRRGQTPQAFQFDTILKAHKKANEGQEVLVTDDCGLVVQLTSEKTFVVEGEEKNIKVTYPEDLVLADKLFQLQTISLNNYSEDDVKKSLKGSVVVIFGGNRGIGQEISDLARQLGAETVCLSRASNCDITNYQSVESALSEVLKNHTKIDHVINTAAVLKIKRFEEKSIHEIVDEVNINFIGNLNIAKASLSTLKESQGSLTFFTSSSYTRGRENYSLYSSSKAAVVNYVQALSEEIIRDGVRVNVINPERANTPMRWENFGDEPKDTLLDPVKIAKVTLSSICSNITGQVISVTKD